MIPRRPPFPQTPEPALKKELEEMTRKIAEDVKKESVAHIASMDVDPLDWEDEHPQEEEKLLSASVKRARRVRGPVNLDEVVHAFHDLVRDYDSHGMSLEVSITLKRKE